MAQALGTNSLYQKKLRTGKLSPRVTAYYFKQWVKFLMEFHAHDRAEIMYVLTGKCMVETEEASIPLKKGEFILLDANVSHRLLVHDACRMLNVEFEFIDGTGDGFPISELISQNLDLSSFLEGELPYYLLKDDGEVYPTLKSIVLQLDSPRGNSGSMVNLMLYRLLLQIARLVEDAASEGQGSAQAYVKKALEYLHSHYDQPLQMKDVGAAVSLHPGYLHRIFKTEKGCTVMEYLTVYRIEKALMLLANSDIPVIEISEYIGISSRQYFSALFKKQTGQTPQAYRKSIQMQKSTPPKS